ncbi:hypothetical protein DL96DRAFT_1832 [Flagelloscypha sp. PMI_526]|nr:hypothetical protein DL96DRAFT_1832 [Flagelloscypha sp. PMI_526]
MDAPLHTLPYELLERIFNEYLVGQPHELTSGSTPILLLSQVCSRWRNVVSSTPQYWSTFTVDICIGLDKVHLKKIENTINLLHLYHNNSQPVHLNITIFQTRSYGSFDSSSEEWKASHRLIEDICLQSARWQKVQFDVYASESFASVPPFQANCLRSLSFFKSWAASIGDLTHIKSFWNSPVLDTLVTFGDTSDDFFPFISYLFDKTSPGMGAPSPDPPSVHIDTSASVIKTMVPNIRRPISNAISWTLENFALTVDPKMDANLTSVVIFHYHG